MIKGNQDQIFSIAKLNKNIILTGGYDKKIFVWNWKHQSQKKTLRGHNGYVSALAQISGNLFASGSGGEDNSIRIWDWYKGKTIKILTGHQRSIS